MGRSAYDTTDKLHMWGPGTRKESRGKSRDPRGSRTGSDLLGSRVESDLAQRITDASNPKNTTVVYKK
jgi:hypothetical protein